MYKVPIHLIDVVDTKKRFKAHQNLSPPNPTVEDCKILLEC